MKSLLAGLIALQAATALLPTTASASSLERDPVPFLILIGDDDDDDDEDGRRVGPYTWIERGYGDDRRRSSYRGWNRDDDDDDDLRFGSGYRVHRDDDDDDDRRDD